MRSQSIKNQFQAEFGIDQKSANKSSKYGLKFIHEIFFIVWFELNTNFFKFKRPFPKKKH